jgi:redox-sensitive bicupin YhaK (pirin superfamily)
MIKHRPANTRKYMNAGWIETYRSFSNNSYWDPNYVNYSILEVINDDRVQPHNFVPIHQHMDMEILGYVIDGPCYHNDNLRNILQIPTGAVQRMTAGSGIWHLEGNNSDKPIRYLQIWLRPNKMGIAPKYEAYQFDPEDKLDKFATIASQKGSPITIQSDAIVTAGVFTRYHTENLDPQRKYYLYIISGIATINGSESVEGDAYMFEQEKFLEISNPDNSEMILFNLP